MATTVDRLVTELAADPSGLLAGFRTAGRALETFDGETKQVNAALAKLGDTASHKVTADLGQAVAALKTLGIQARSVGDVRIAVATGDLEAATTIVRQLNADLVVADRAIADLTARQDATRRQPRDDRGRFITEDAAAARQAAEAEAAARALVRQEIVASTRALADYGRTVDATDRAAVASFQAQAQAVRQQAEAARLSRQDLAEIGAVTERFTQRFQAQAAQEVAARAQVRGELGNEIRTLGLYARTVDATNSQAVAAWRREADAIRQQAREVALARDGVLKLEAVIQQAERNFQRAAVAARSMAAATAPAGAANAALGGLVTQTGRFSQLGQRAGTAAVGVAFGLEAIARGGDAADTGVRTALRAIASLGVAFGPQGLLVSGIAATTAAMLDLFDRSRDEAEKTRRKFEDEINQMLRAGDFLKLQAQLQDIEVGTPDIGKANAGLSDLVPDAFIGGLKDTEARAKRAREELDRLLAAQDRLRDPSVRGIGMPVAVLDSDEIRAARAELKRLGDDLTRLKGQRDALDTLLRNPPALPRRPQGLPSRPNEADGRETARAITAGAREPLQDLQAEVRDLVTAFTQLGPAQFEAAGLGNRARALFAQVGATLADNTDVALGTANALRAVGAELASIPSTKRVDVTGNVILPPEAVARSVEAAITRIPETARNITANLTVEPDEASVEQAIRDAKAAAQSFADTLPAITLAAFTAGTEDDAQAIRARAAALGVLRQQAGAAAKAIQASTISDTQKADALKRLKESFQALGIDIDAIVPSTNKVADGLEAAVTAGRGLVQIADSLGGIDDQARRALDGVLGLLGGIQQLRAAQDLSGLAKTLGQIGGAVGVIGGIASLASSLFGGDDEQAQAIEANTRALRDFRASLDPLTDSMTGAINAFNFAESLFGENAEARRRAEIRVGEGNAREILGPLAKDFGLTIDQLIAIADQYGVTLIENGELVRNSALTLRDVLADAAIAAATFAKTVQGQADRLDARRQLTDTDDDPARGVADAFKIIQQFAPDLSKSLGAFNLATEQGVQQFLASLASPEVRANLDAAILALFDQIAAGTIDPALFAGFEDAEQFVDFLLQAEAGLDDVAEAAAAVAAAVTKFTDDLAGQRARRALHADVFNLDDEPLAAAQRAIEGELAELAKFAPNLGRIFDGLDASTEQGRAEIEAALQGLFTAVEDGLLTPAALGDLSFDDLTSIIGNVAGGLDAFREAMGETAEEAAALTDSLRNVPEGFKPILDAIRFDATQAEAASRERTADTPGAAASAEDAARRVADALAGLGGAQDQLTSQTERQRDALRDATDALTGTTIGVREFGTSLTDLLDRIRTSPIGPAPSPGAPAGSAGTATARASVAPSSAAAPVVNEYHFHDGAFRVDARDKTGPELLAMLQAAVQTAQRANPGGTDVLRYRRAV